ncbi:peptide chain release factor 2 [Bacillus cereus 95/8201]|nr:peptide chain release factor 2 [Bacillus cereus 95/8201]
MYAKGIQTHEILEELQGSIPVYHDADTPGEVVNDFSIAQIEPFLKNLETIINQQSSLYEQNSLLAEQVIKSDQRAEQIHEQLIQSDKRNHELQGQLQDLTDKMDTLIKIQEAAATTEKQPWYKRILK